MNLPMNHRPFSVPCYVIADLEAEQIETMYKPKAVVLVTRVGFYSERPLTVVRESPVHALLMTVHGDSYDRARRTAFEQIAMRMKQNPEAWSEIFRLAKESYERL